MRETAQEGSLLSEPVKENRICNANIKTAEVTKQ